MRNAKRASPGFTIPEVIVAGSIMIILCVGTLSVFSYVVKINRGNNLRMQALTVLQYEVEYYRSLKFVPVGSDSALDETARSQVGTRDSPDGRRFDIFVTVTNDPAGTSNANAKFKIITIEAIPEVAERDGWLQQLHTDVTIQRVRSN